MESRFSVDKAVGLPCVVTDVGDSAVIVDKLGVVVPPNDPVALEEGWLQCINLITDDMKRAVRARIKEEFSVQALVSKTLKALEETVDPSSTQDARQSPKNTESVGY